MVIRQTVTPQMFLGRYADGAVTNAKLELRDAELSLTRRTIVSPIGGMVGILPSEAGRDAGAFKRQ